MSTTSRGARTLEKPAAATEATKTKQADHAGPQAAQPPLQPGSPVTAVIERARDMGLMSATTRQVGARLPLKLLQQAKKRTGITSTTDLLSFALANVAVDDNFATAFVAARGKLDPDLDIGF